jgi:hypothetical protein
VIFRASLAAADSPRRKTGRLLGGLPGSCSGRSPPTSLCRLPSGGLRDAEHFTNQCSTVRHTVLGLDISVDDYSPAINRVMTVLKSEYRLAEYAENRAQRDRASAMHQLRSIYVQMFLTFSAWHPRLHLGCHLLRSTPSQNTQTGLL